MKQINPNLIKLAEQTYNPNLKVNSSILEEKTPEPTLTNAPNLNGFIYIPSIKLYVAKQTTLHNKTWYQAHEELNKQGSQMLTIKQFAEFLKYLKKDHSNKQEADAILDEILTVRTPWRAEWLDADFKVYKNKLHINYAHKLINGKLNPQNSEPLEDCLMQDKTPGIDLGYWLNNSTSQGLPTKDTPEGDLYYWYPRNDNNSVARFIADSDRVNFNCSRNPQNSSSALGVREARAKRN